MRLDQELVRRGLCESRTEAQELVSRGHVILNGNVISKQSKEVTEDDEISLVSARKYVSRGGEKLEGALLHVFGTDEHVKDIVRGRRALDVGSSTGGFTDCLLKYGAGKVEAVDVGTGQLHSSLRTHPGVTSFEHTDIRDFTSGVPYDIIVADLSFIPLERVFDDILRHSHKGTFCFFLIKPQFEVGKGNTKKGIVKDEALVESTLEKYLDMAHEKHLLDARIFPCSLRGGDGNQEYFLYAKR